MKPHALAAAAGALFGTGLLVSGMTTPSKVIGFLDFFGAWDPSLALVMVGAIAVYAVAFRWVLRREGPLLGLSFDLPKRTELDARLVGGAAIFGVGWGLGGYCPGPALVGVGSASLGALAFVVSMTVGMVIARPLSK